MGGEKFASKFGDNSCELLYNLLKTFEIFHLFFKVVWTWHGSNLLLQTRFLLRWIFKWWMAALLFCKNHHPFFHFRWNSLRAGHVSIRAQEKTSPHILVLETHATPTPCIKCPKNVRKKTYLGKEIRIFSSLGKEIRIFSSLGKEIRIFLP